MMTTVHKKSPLAGMRILPNPEKKNEKPLNSARVKDELTKNFLLGKGSIEKIDFF